MGPLTLVLLVLGTASLGVIEPLCYLRRAHRQIREGTFTE